MKVTSYLIVLFCVFLIAPAKSVAEAPPEKMVRVPEGCFMMGTNETHEYEEGRKNDREKPAHEVCLSAFYLDIHEADQESFERIMGYNPSIMKGKNLPVDRMDHREARVYCAKQGKRLPTEAEWEYAARAGSQAINPWGEGVNGDYLWYASNSVRKPHPVGSRKPNAWGLHDMMGSVWEWVADWYSDTYYQESPVQNPKGPKRQSWRVIRGASWVEEANFIRVTIRYRGLADPTETFLVGTRCARDLTPAR